MLKNKRVNALSGLYLIVTINSYLVSDVVLPRVNALSGLYLIVTVMSSYIEKVQR